MRKLTTDEKNNMIEPYDRQLLAWAKTSASVKVRSYEDGHKMMIDIVQPSGMTWIYFMDKSMIMSRLLRTRLLEAHFNETKEKRDA